MDALESSLFVDRTPGLRQEVNLIDSGGMVSEQTGDLAFPWGDGRAIFDSVFNGYVLVWRDATQHWHYIDMSDVPEVAAEMNNEPFHTVDESFLYDALDETYKLGQKIGSGVEQAAKHLPEVLDMLPWIIGGLVVLEGLRALKR